MKNPFPRSQYFALVIFILCAVFDPGINLWANGLAYSPHLVSETPFDQRLDNAGFFNESKINLDKPHKSKPRSANELFMIARSYRYVSNPENIRWQSAEETSLKGSGNCADKAVWLYTELKKNGYNNVSLMIGKYHSFDSIFHAWVVYVDKSEQTWLLDSAMQIQPWKAGDLPESFYVPFYSFSGEIRYCYRQISHVVQNVS